MINSNHTWLSLLDVVCRFNSSDQYIPLCTSHNRFLSAIPAVTPFLSGFEYHLLSLTKPCDSLVCMLTRDLHTFARLSSIGDDDKKEHLLQANHATEILLQLPELLCVTDHVWFELDAYPNNALSLFVGNHSNIQSMDEIPLGHKIAMTDLNEGDTILKYGHDIGKVVKSIKKGEHVHVHNVKTKKW